METFQGVALTVTSLQSIPFISLKQDENDETLLVEGIFVDIFMELANLLNFSIVVTSPPDNQHGVMKSDGTWSGMIGQLVEEEVDVGTLPHCFLHFS